MAIPDFLQPVRDLFFGTKINQGYGCTGYYLEGRYGTCPHFHLGIDYDMRVGTKVYSPASGTIIESGWNPVYGNRIIVRTAEGYTAMLAHLSQLSARIGTTVKAGDLLGLSGNTGSASSGPHLHFEIRDRSGQPVNPCGGGSMTSEICDTPSKIFNGIKSIFKWDALGATPTEVVPPTPTTGGTGSIQDAINNFMSGILQGTFPGLSVINQALKNDVVPITFVLLTGVVLSFTGLKMLGKQSEVKAVTNVAIEPIRAVKSGSKKVARVGAAVASRGASEATGIGSKIEAS